MRYIKTSSLREELETKFTILISLNDDSVVDTMEFIFGFFNSEIFIVRYAYINMYLILTFCNRSWNEEPKVHCFHKSWIFSWQYHQVEYL